MLRTVSGNGSGFFNNFIQRSMPHRQVAEIQLQALINDPEESMPAYARRASDHLSTTDELSIEQVSKLLNTQPFIIERLMHALSASTEGENITSLKKNDVRKLTQVLNGTMNVRALLFFMMLDENGDHYVSADELSNFYERYLKDIRSFDSDRLSEIVPVLLQKFCLHT
ncbi:unnamed protein product, partial [Didymodactylos carnosus]